ncbi:FeoB-associated Cys-rich membrane protein [Psychroserpens burtonensis]|uniref:FeoB-associated Cys-rich membrane protein n=1 Tax=Psychroserpens burtonensis TaxID=49278 RepID=A0A5C7B797_9FLAO|nr:FeoB-associated Cys-rich membrane protein [Psychroserpens burtonensis]TXE17889.1 FeoB-associated Cys-rich membrane protein [Psychroserpens burtonensis]
MNIVIQNILVFTSLAIAIWFLLRRFGVLPKKKTASSKACGQDDCGCH